MLCKHRLMPKTHLRRYSDPEIENLKKLGSILKRARESRPEHERSQRAFARYLSNVTGESWNNSLVQWCEQAGDYVPGKDSPRVVNLDYLKAVYQHTDLKHWHSLAYLLSLSDGLYVEFLQYYGDLATYLIKNDPLPNNLQALIIQLLEVVRQRGLTHLTVIIESFIKTLEEIKRQEHRKRVDAATAFFIRSEIEAANIDAVEFADRAGLSVHVIDHILDGFIPELSIDQLRSIAAACKTTSTKLGTLVEAYEEDRNKKLSADQTVSSVDS